MAKHVVDLHGVEAEALELLVVALTEELQYDEVVGGIVAKVHNLLDPLAVARELTVIDILEFDGLVVRRHDLQAQVVVQARYTIVPEAQHRIGSTLE